jgi:tRNA threonylcarbamoyladenosine biosynthesis protein TsaE
MDIFKTHITKSAEETQTLGTAVADHLKASGRKRVICCLYGELGTGKTTFTQGLALGYGITDRLLSPTFVLLRSYPMPVGGGVLHHIDLYRLQPGQSEGTVLLHELLEEDQAIICIEWPDRLGGLLPVPRIDIHCSLVEDGHRLTIKEIAAL